MTKEFKQKYYCWLICIICCLYAGATMGIVSNCSGVFYKPVANDLKVGVGSISLYITILNISFALITPFIGKIINKVNVQLLTTFGSIVVTACVYAMSLFTKPYQFYIDSAILGIGYSCICTLTINVILNNWFKKKHGFITGIVMSFGGIPGVFLTSVFSKIIQVSGFRIAYIVMAIIVGVTTIPFSIFFTKLKPSDIGLKAYGEDEVVVETKKEINDKNVSTMAYVLIIIYGLVATGPIGMGFHMPAYAETIGLTASVGSIMSSICMFSNVVSKLLLGYLCDRFGVIKSMLGYSFVTLLGIIMLKNCGSSLLLAYSAPLLFGTIYAISSVGTPLVVKKTVGDVKFSSFFAYVNICTTGVNAAMITVYGLMYDSFGSYNIPLYMAIGFCTSLIVILFVLKKNINEEK